jgi:type I restriction enzyme, R subunit
MIARNPLRTDFHARFQEIIAAYNKETDRATIEKTFELLVDLVKDLDHEEQRAVREGLTEEHLAVFDLLCRKKESLDPRARERVKNIAMDLLGQVKTELAKLEDWREKEQTRARVRTLIHDYLYSEKTGLPEAYSEDEIKVVSNVVFQHVFTQYRTATDHPYRDVA